MLRFRGTMLIRSIFLGQLPAYENVRPPLYNTGATFWLNVNSTDSEQKPFWYQYDYNLMKSDSDSNFFLSIGESLRICFCNHIGNRYLTILVHMIAKEFVYTIILRVIRKHFKFFWIIKGNFCFTALKSKNNTIVCCLINLFTAYRGGSNCQTEQDYRLIKMGTLCGLSYVCLFNCFSTCFKDKKFYHSECFGFFGTFCFNICSGYF